MSFRPGARQFFERRGAPLPYDAEVEYLESTGTQYIVLPITAGQCYGFDLSMIDVATTAYNVYVGNGTSNDFCVGVNNGDINSSYVRIRTALTWANNTGATKLISANNGIITANGANVGTYDASLPLGNNNNAMGMFAYSGGGLPSICRIMSYKLYGSVRELLLDVIPVRFTNELGQSEGAMYDRVSGQLFRNAGTGAFTIGPDKTAWTNPYVTDGLVAMWDGEWNAGGGVHDANATVWKDLSGNEYDFGIPSTGVSWSDDSISLANTSLNCQLPDVSRQSFTIECTASGTGNDGAFVWMKNPSWIGGALLSWQAVGVCYYPWTEIGRIGDKSLHSVSLSWGATKQILVKDGIAVVSTTGTIDVRNVLSQIFIGEYNGAKMTTMNAYCIRLYSRALATAEIAANYAIDKARFNLP